MSLVDTSVLLLQKWQLLRVKMPLGLVVLSVRR